MKWERGSEVVGGVPEARNRAECWAQPNRSLQMFREQIPTGMFRVNSRSRSEHLDAERCKVFAKSAFTLGEY